ncbi:MAG: small basic family protein [Clostridia bacterium]|nr:small basic family protein [Clostridia bacterium]
MVIIIFCLLLGIMTALFVPFNIPSEITQYVAVALLAGFDSIFGGIVANLNNNFKMNIFLTGFFGNALLAALITYIGTLLNVNLSIAAIVVFGTRLFQNFAIIRRFWINKYMEKINDKNN